MKKLLLFIYLIIIFSTGSIATEIEGTIYDLSLRKVPNSLIEINTEPQQKYVSIDGQYTLNVPPGKYTLIAKFPATGTPLLIDIEEIEIKEEGTFNLDLFLIDDLSDLDEYYNEPDIDEDLDPTTKKTYWEYIFLTILILIIIGVIIYLKSKPKPIPPITPIIKEEPKNLATQVLNFIEKEERATQKDIRKQFPYSEAKISLIISELEHNNKIKKIKKGRGNIIIINKPTKDI